MSFLAPEHRIRADVVVFGGGIAGLWALAQAVAAGHDAILLENQSLGYGQSRQAQGIIHGGGKYALRGVGDVAAMRAIRDMPARWRSHLSGEAEPDLSAATTLSSVCHLWLPRGSWRARLESWGMVPVLTSANVLASRPRKLARSEWPSPLDTSAVAVMQMDEPVLDTRSVLSALATPLLNRVFAYQGPGEDDTQSDAAVQFMRRDDIWNEVHVRPAADERPVAIEAGAFVLAAGRGNAALLSRADVDPSIMQTRPLRMVMLRGNLPKMYGHCVFGGKTRITITSATMSDGSTCWQLGGEIAEAGVDDESMKQTLRRTKSELARCLPGFSLSGLRIASYRAVRAEAKDPQNRRPSGVHLERVGANAWVVWPTKWALAPLLAEEIVAQLPAPAVPAVGADRAMAQFGFPVPELAPFPWEEARWIDVD